MLISSAVFNFWEPLHYLDRGYGFQTWETSPVYAIRSYAYILLHLFPTKFIALILGLGVDKVRPVLPRSFDWWLNIIKSETCIFRSSRYPGFSNHSL